MLKRMRVLATGVSTLVLCLGLSPASQAVRAAPPLTPVLTWLQAARLDSRILFAGGYQCPPQAIQGAYCPTWTMRSGDGGTTWIDLGPSMTRVADANGASGSGCEYTLAPLAIDASGRQVVSAIDGGCATASSTFSALLYSPDTAASWHEVFEGNKIGPYGYGTGPALPSFSPLPPYRLFAVDRGEQWDPILVATLAGRGLRDGTNPATAGAASPADAPNDTVDSLMPDPANPSGVYANAERTASQPNVPYVAHSGDAGQTWALVAPPTGVTAFRVALDPASATRLMAVPLDTGVAADSRFFSDDGGARWTAGTCPGERDGACPLLIVADTFAAGSTFALHPDGLYVLDVDGPARGRAAIIVPAAPTSVLTIAGGGAAGAPIYLATKPTGIGHSGALYRSADGGGSWHDIGANLLATTQLDEATVPALVPVKAPDTRARVVPGSDSGYFAATHHTVAAAFFPFWASYGDIATFGLPLSEAFTANGQMVQYFERARLVIAGGAVQVSPLGSLLTAARTFPPAAPVPFNAALRYFPATRHTLRGLFLSYWRAKDGAVLLGDPISEPLREMNGDRSGRTYLVQYFQNGRLEYHPESAGPRYRVQLGRVGYEYLRQQALL